MEANKFICSNKMRIILIPSSSKLISMSLYLNKGSYMEDENVSGLAHFVEHMMFKGTINRPGDQLIKESRELGFYFNASTAMEYTQFELYGIHEYVKEGIDILFDLFLNLKYNQVEFAKEKNVVLQEYYGNMSNPSFIIYQILIFNMMKDKYKRLTIGNPDTINSITISDINDYIKENYKFENAIFVISGYFDERTVLASIQDTILKYTKEKITIKPYVTPQFKDNNIIIPKNTKKRIIVKHNHTSNQSAIYIGFKCYNILSYKYYILNCISKYLTGGIGSKLFNLLRNDQGVTYNVSSNLALYKKEGMFYFYVGADINKITIAIETILKELENIKKNEISKDDLKIVKTMTKRNLYSYTENIEDLKDYYGYNEVLGLNLSIADDLKNFNEVTPEKMKKVANEIFTKDNILITSNYNFDEESVEKMIDKYL